MAEMSNKNNNDEMMKKMKVEKEVIQGLEQEIDVADNTEQALLERIERIEEKYAHLLKESHQESNNVIWIELTMCGIFFIGAAILFYATTINKK